MDFTFDYAPNQRVKLIQFGIRGVVRSVGVGDDLKDFYWVRYVDNNGKLQDVCVTPEQLTTEKK